MARPASATHGLLVVDKPGGITSRDAVDRAQGWFPRGTKLGHTGTLDPLATGVLVLCVGQATRLGEYVQRMRKTYRAGVRLGCRSDTDDADGRVEEMAVAVPPERDAVARALEGFVGEIEQRPPAFSAAKVAGSRAYDLARAGREVDLRARRVQIYQIDVIDYGFPRLEIEVQCGKGTYIRSVARDLGERLGCGGMIASLRRTRVGPFDVAAAVALDADEATARANVWPLAAAVAELPRVVVDEGTATRLRRGQAMRLPACERPAVTDGQTAEVAVFAPGDVLVAVGVVEPGERLIRPGKVFHRPGGP